MTAQEELDALLEKARGLGVKIVPKEGRWWRALAWLVMVVTFGQNRAFLKSYVTTIYKTIGVPGDWDGWDPVVKLEILTHELVHVRQLQQWTPPGFFLCYLLLPLPLGLAWCRYRLEREAYAAGYAVSLRYKIADRAELIDEAVNQLTGSGYGWAWPFKARVRAWFEKNV